MQQIRQKNQAQKRLDTIEGALINSENPDLF